MGGSDVLLGQVGSAEPLEAGGALEVAPVDPLHDLIMHVLRNILIHNNINNCINYQTNMHNMLKIMKRKYIPPQWVQHWRLSLVWKSVAANRSSWKTRGLRAQSQPCSSAQDSLPQRRWRQTCRTVLDLRRVQYDDSEKDMIWRVFDEISLFFFIIKIYNHLLSFNVYLLLDSFL